MGRVHPQGGGACLSVAEAKHIVHQNRNLVRGSGLSHRFDGLKEIGGEVSQGRHGQFLFPAARAVLLPRDRCELRIATALALVGGRGQPLREG